MTCRFKPAPQPKRETTLERLRRQAKAINRIMANHNGEIGREQRKAQRAQYRAQRVGARYEEKMKKFSKLHDDLQYLAVGYN
jgi:glucose-6-phosphate isomerase